MESMCLYGFIKSKLIASLPVAVFDLGDTM